MSHVVEVSPPVLPLFGRRYQAMAEIGRGAMGIVFEARDIEKSAPVAVKVLNPDRAHERQDLRRFIREATYMSRIQHEHTVRVLDQDMRGDTPFLVMELISGSDLGAILQGGRRLPLSQVVPLI